MPLSVAAVFTALNYGTCALQAFDSLHWFQAVRERHAAELGKVEVSVHTHSRPQLRTRLCVRVCLCVCVCVCVCV